MCASNLCAGKKSVLSHSLWTLDQFDVAEKAGRKRFHDFQLSLCLMHAISDLNFSYCTPIQEQVLSSALTGRDTIGKAQTGTGKTVAFLVIIIQQLLTILPPKKRFLGEPRALIIAPTRELVMQISKEAQALARYAKLRVTTFIGGMDMDKQRRLLQADYVDILVATPGRLLDFCQRGEVHLDMVECLVIDEADRMLDMGFIPQVSKILRQLPRCGDRQTLLFSATFSNEVMRLGRQWAYEPMIVEIDPESVATEQVAQKMYLVRSQDKCHLLHKIISKYPLNRILIFANRRNQTTYLVSKLKTYKIEAHALSGEVSQNKRLHILERFRSGAIKVLVATDVAGRGIHIDGITHVINYTLPEDPQEYVHRIGRTGRAGQKGTAISFATEDDAFQIPAMEKLLGHKIICELPPEDI